MSQKCALNICNKLKQYDADDKNKNCTTAFILISFEKLPKKPILWPKFWIEIERITKKVKKKTLKLYKSPN